MRAAESKLRVVVSMAAPPALLLVAWGFWVVSAPQALIAIVVVFAAVLAYVMLLDFPTAIVVDSIGIHRECVLRRRVLEWNDITGIVQPRRGGLVVVTKDRKRHVLLDRSLDGDELENLRAAAISNQVRAEF
jgi:hypothetical protein